MRIATRRGARSRVGAWPAKGPLVERLGAGGCGGGWNSAVARRARSCGCVSSATSMPTRRSGLALSPSSNAARLPDASTTLAAPPNPAPQAFEHTAVGAGKQSVQTAGGQTREKDGGEKGRGAKPRAEVLVAQRASCIRNRGEGSPGLLAGSDGRAAEGWRSTNFKRWNGGTCPGWKGNTAGEEEGTRGEKAREVWKLRRGRRAGVAEGKF